MIIILCLNLLVFNVYLNLAADDKILTNFEDFQSLFNKSYAHKFDEQRSRAAFNDNKNVVVQHNERYKNGKSTFRMRMNIMADLNTDNYLRSFLRLLRSQRKPDSGDDANAEMVGASLSTANLPEQVDWRAEGLITDADNQRTCGSCYAFAITQSITGQIFKRTGKILKLSTQQIVDCSVSHGNLGCTGGSLRNTLRYLQDTGGVMRDQDYKYMSKKSKCQFVGDLAVVNITSWAILPAKNEDAMMAAVAQIGPIAVSINATPRSFQLYSDGIYDDEENCKSTSVNHAMLIIGYTKDYWIVKNWWGEAWGEKGYMRVKRGKNMCGIANYSAYAIV